MADQGLRNHELVILVLHPKHKHLPLKVGRLEQNDA